MVNREKHQGGTDFRAKRKPRMLTGNSCQYPGLIYPGLIWSREIRLRPDVLTLQASGLGAGRTFSVIGFLQFTLCFGHDFPFGTLSGRNRCQTEFSSAEAAKVEQSNQATDTLKHSSLGCLGTGLASTKYTNATKGQGCPSRRCCSMYRLLMPPDFGYDDRDNLA